MRDCPSEISGYIFVLHSSAGAVVSATARGYPEFRRRGDISYFPTEKAIELNTNDSNQDERAKGKKDTYEEQRERIQARANESPCPEHEVGKNSAHHPWGAALLLTT